MAWSTIPVTKIGMAGYLPNGEPKEASVVTFNAYVANEVSNIIDYEGHEVLSSAQIYLIHSSLTVEQNDKFRLSDNKDYTIKKIRDYYDGNTGIPVLKVVYL